ncbi:hypothetical protein [Microbacterium sp. Leaf436]|uniref:hypothetical protein n=1 Tax=Microbacterium sp. Leaf436 TaxID=1736377 RepID=UPI0006FBAF53|nr:hypothetical protein [Microbacterium sp. Leaf436]KQT72001.1 hypothetical protein ASG45_13565 [Microbacterium sp. Leaf436]
MTVVRYTPDQMAGFQAAFERYAEELIIRHNIPDPDGSKFRKLIRYYYEDLDEWTLVLGYR